MTIPETDPEDSSDDEIVPIRKKRSLRNRIESDSSDEEDQIRKSMYETEDPEDNEGPIEDNAYSKATRRSIGDFKPRTTMLPRNDSSDDSSDSDDIIIEEPENNSIGTTDGEQEREQGDEQKENSSYTALAVSHLSSTLRSPLQQINRSINASFNNSIGNKMSSTTMSNKANSDLSVSDAESSLLLDEAAGGDMKIKNETSLLQVSRSEYAAAAAEKEKVSNEIQSVMKLLDMKQQLPDKGAKLQIRLNNLLDQLEGKTSLVNSMEINESLGVKQEISKKFENSAISINDSIEAVADVIKKIEAVQPKYTGKTGLKNFTEQKDNVVKNLVEMQQAIEGRPAEDVLADPPKYLKIELMKHQRHGIAFMEWRETQSPHGGFLADDMGLGKTLTTICLILRAIQRHEDDGEESTDDEDDADPDGWTAKGRKDYRDGGELRNNILDIFISISLFLGTLIICPASLVKQWEAEIKDRVKRGALETYVFHGPNREYRAKTLAKYDVVITTYQIVVQELKSNGCLFGVKWKRCVLDEGHVIRNHKSKQSEAVCALKAKYRWVLTGTPIQNKEFDLFAAIKFLRCRPFDDLLYWKRWIENSKGSSPKVQVLLKSILLRRTKQELISSGEIESLPGKSYEEVIVLLNKEERYVYNRVMAYSQHIFAQFMTQCQEKNNNFTYDKERLGKAYKQFTRRFQCKDREIKQVEILMLLLRLRQICCHPGLIKNAIENLTAETGEAQEDENDESCDDLMKNLEHLNINDDEEEAAGDRFSSDNEVFNMDVPSSKVERVIETLREKIVGTNDKAIVVSQWTSYLNIIRGMLEIEGITYCELNGTVPVKYRNEIVEKFNKPNSGIQIMLLSLTAGGVGLNLTGANYLFLMDLHWNPQLEQQAQDRIYRFGQKKNVKIIK